MKTKTTNIGNKNAVGPHLSKYQSLIIGLIQKEIDWCKNHKDNSPLSDTSIHFYIKGLEQAKVIAQKADKFNPYVLELE
jgi:hypothetical protein